MVSGKGKLIALTNKRSGHILDISTKKRNTPMVEGATYSLHVKSCKNDNRCFREVESCDIVMMTYDVL